jgi:hypothetical protein
MNDFTARMASSARSPESLKSPRMLPAVPRSSQFQAVTSFPCGLLYFTWITPNERERPAAGEWPRCRRGSSRAGAPDLVARVRVAVLPAGSATTFAQGWSKTPNRGPSSSGVRSIHGYGFPAAKALAKSQKLRHATQLYPAVKARMSERVYARLSAVHAVPTPR